MTSSANSLRSNCPINYSLEVIGDSWSLLIVRDIVFAGKKTFAEFLASDEHIARNILTSRLRKLQENGILTKSPHPTDKRSDIYNLSAKGEELIPTLSVLSKWGYDHYSGSVPVKTPIRLTIT